MDSKIVIYDEVAPSRERGLKRLYVSLLHTHNLHDQLGIAHDVLKDLGLTRQEVKAMNLSEYDAKALRKIERYPSHGQLYEKKKRKA